jgi:HEPN domain-containing protein
MSEESEFDVEKEIVYWRDVSIRDLQFAGRLIEYKEEEILYCFFYLHLAIEKALKAHIVKRTKNLPPKTHNLLVLAEIGEVQMSREQIDFCGRINRYNIEARYPNLAVPAPTLEKAKEYFEQTKELLEWLINQL